jgi:hypothetical protein
VITHGYMWFRARVFIESIGGRRSSDCKKIHEQFASSDVVRHADFKQSRIRNPEIQFTSSTIAT